MRARWIAWIGVALLAACSQEDPGLGNGGDSGSGGSGGTGGAAGSAGSDDSNAVDDDYYPMVAGSTLTYRHSGKGRAAWDDATEVSATEWNGESAWITEGAPDSKGETSKNTIIQIGTQLLRAHKEEFRSGTLTGTVDYEPGFIRFDRAWADEDVGFSEVIGYMRTEKTAAGNVIAEDLREHTYTIEAKSMSVEVPAGTVEDCIQVRRLRTRNNPANASDDDDKIFWFCKGIGKTKEVAVVEGGGGTEELVGCDIEGGRCP